MRRLILTLSGLRKAPPEVSAKYLKNGLADHHQLYRSSFKIKILGIGHSLLAR